MCNAGYGHAKDKQGHANNSIHKWFLWVEMVTGIEIYVIYWKI
jgi:hypothetical protein